ncbi:hypothetical protein [Methylobacterium sp. WL8]|uniref:hypothetical protein n=1 Tax=Methylobacterium sp. WL8 TaxID=2603899 RepID=UPI0011CB4183|nr:hypothetical protein [Methylobacterium sp. WL8]TXN85071.1 hypothetical protein FV234_00525 [Methylobacterium sp. WL8]
MRGRGAAAALLAALAPASAGAWDGQPFYGYALDGEGPGYPLSLPQTLRATIVVPLAARPVPRANTLAEFYPALAACWRPPASLEDAPDIEITARLSLRRDGSLIGPPRITYARGVGPKTRPTLVHATLEGLSRCLPARITPGLGRAIAGRPVALRFVYRKVDANRPG